MRRLRPGRYTRAQERGIDWQQGPGMDDAVHGVLGFLCFRGTDGAHHGHGNLAQENTDRIAAV